MLRKHKAFNVGLGDVVWCIDRSVKRLALPVPSNAPNLWRRKIWLDYLGCHTHNNYKLEVLKAAIMNLTLSWDASSCSFVRTSQHTCTLVPMYQNTWCQTLEVKKFKIIQNRRITPEATYLVFHTTFSIKWMNSSASNNKITRLNYKTWLKTSPRSADGNIFKEFVRFLHIVLNPVFEPNLRHCKICVLQNCREASF